MAEKRYYWLKLKADFFTQPKIKKLRNMAGGDTFTIIYLKMQLLTLNTGGQLFFEGIEDDFIEELALKLDEEEDNVRLTVSYLQSKGLLELIDNDEYLLTEVQDVTGSEAASTVRSRKCRGQQKYLPVIDEKALQCNTDATNCNTEIDIDKETDKELEKDIEKKKDRDIEKNHIVEIVDYLNLVCNRQFKATTTGTVKFIKARLKEGFEVEDFKTVIDKKANEWLGTNMENYLRPETLFGTKFESYLNQSTTAREFGNQSKGKSILDRLSEV